MRAVCWHGKEDVRVDTVPDPEILDPKDVIVRITSTAICGSDLHLYGGFMPMMKEGDILGHEPMGVVVDIGSDVRRLRKGDRVVVPFTISCGSCFFCRRSLYSLCDNTNPNAAAAEKLMGHAPTGVFGYSHVLGGYAGGQAEYLRVPFADVGCVKIESDIPDDRVLFLSDILPTGWMAAENAEIEEGDTVAVWGAGPVGQFAMASAWLMGAGRVIAIDRVPERLEMARRHNRADTIDFDEESVSEQLLELTGGRGPDRCIDAVGTEAHGMGMIDSIVDNVKQKVRLGTDRAHVLREAIISCRKGGTVSIPGVYVGMVDKVPVGAAMNKALTIRSGQTHVQRYTGPLLQMIENGEIDPTFVITHELPLEQAPAAFRMFRDKQDECVKVVLKVH
ncbi:MAG TPA: zinc-dependent alcohol dehydrogenase [Longimicrobiales bacterium]